MAVATREWVDFFVKAGIPSDEATSYAIIFSKNRIQKNMLADLNKEYLKDMGITLLGDVIAILKHAKTVHENNSRAWVMSEPIASEEVTSKTANPTLKTTKEGSSVKRLLDHYTKKYKEAEESLTTNPETAPRKKIKLKPKKNSPEPNLSLPIEKKEISERPVTTPKITITDGKNVFARLGDGSVSSTTDLPLSKKKVSPSVFARLGGVSSSTPPEKNESLQYKGTFKNHPEAVPSLTGTMRADTVGISAKKKSQADFLKARDLKMLKITTEFSDEDEPTPVPSPEKVPIKVERTDKKRHSDEASSTSTAKKVRFGGTSTLLMRKEPVQPTVFASHTIVTKSSVVTAPIEKVKVKQENVGIRARIGVVKPRPAKLIGKMVADTIKRNAAIAGPDSRSRVPPKAKSIHDRLG